MNAAREYLFPGIGEYGNLGIFSPLLTQYIKRLIERLAIWIPGPC